MSKIVNGELHCIWTVVDVQQEHPRLSEEQAHEVLERVCRDFDANDGVNWSAIERAVVALGYPVGEGEENDEA